MVNGDIKSCGCLTNQLKAQSKIKDLSNQEFGYLRALYRLNKQDNNGNYYWHCKCLNCGSECEAIAASLISGNKQSCGCIKSIGEKEIRTLLTQNNITYQTEYTFENLRSINGDKLKYDFYLPEYNRLIEFDGEQHYEYSLHGWHTEEHYLQVQERDKIKNNYALIHNIDLVRIPYWERNKITLDLLLGNKYLI